MSLTHDDRLDGLPNGAVILRHQAGTEPVRCVDSGGSE